MAVSEVGEELEERVRYAEKGTSRGTYHRSSKERESLQSVQMRPSRPRDGAPCLGVNLAFQRIDVRTWDDIRGREIGGGHAFGVGVHDGGEGEGVDDWD